MAKPRSEVKQAKGSGDARATEDAGMFRAAVRDVKPLARSARIEPALAKPRKAGARRGAAGRASIEDLAHVMPLLPEAVAPEDSVGGADALSFRRPSVRPQVFRRLRRGLYPVEDDLDLHGLSQADARASLAEFLVRNRDAGRRCVRIVHGKGYRSGARGPVLKIAVNSWLKRHGEVMAFASARAIDGGTGALYVLLRA
jgi:DNA-nicking Smr family endonuclease